MNELGIAEILPNVRGSAGYGKSYLQLDKGMKREDTVKDIGALSDWLKEQPHLDSQRVGVIGGCYGGYMSLATMTHYSERLKCGPRDVSRRPSGAGLPFETRRTSQTTSHEPPLGTGRRAGPGTARRATIEVKQPISVFLNNYGIAGRDPAIALSLSAFAGRECG